MNTSPSDFIHEFLIDVFAITIVFEKERCIMDQALDDYLPQ